MSELPGDFLSRFAGSECLAGSGVAERVKGGHASRFRGERTSLLIALVKLGQWATVIAGPGLVAFTAMVVLTMLASASFNPKLIWERP